MVQKLKAIYRLAGNDNIMFVEGAPSMEVKAGFVFSDFLKKRSFSIGLEIHKEIFKNDVGSMQFESTVESDWNSTEREDYEFGFSIIQNEIEHNHINKAILSRKKVIDQKVKLNTLFLDLCEAYQHSNIFLTETPSGELWIGASPETLLSKKEGEYFTMSLAGTKGNVEDDWTEKEYAEQRIVTTSILAELYKHNIDPTISELETVAAGAVFHLRNIISFNTEGNSLQIAESLHPTPAISGNPKQQAISTIKIAENHDREFYCGYGGIIREDNDIDLFVNLRCASVSSNQICLFIGGGITKDSNLEAEWKECERKAESLARFL